MRTWGVEIECAVSVPRGVLAGMVSEAILPFGHTAVALESFPKDYPANTWQIVPETVSTSFDYPVEAEIISPPLNGNAEVLKAVCDVVSPVSSVNKFCGLHVHHAVKRHELKKIISAWIDIEDVIYQCLPESRQHNKFCKKYSELPVMKKPDRGLKDWVWKYVGNRNMGCNPYSFWKFGTVEFRCFAGTTDFETINKWVGLTRQIITAAVHNRTDSLPELIIGEYNG